MTGEPVTIEKRKWDGSVSARWPALLLSGPPAPWTWVAAAGTRRERPRRGGEVQVLQREERGVALPGGWWVMTAVVAPDGSIERYEVDAATPVRPVADGTIGFIDLDLDLEAPGDGSGDVVLQDADQFAARARSMGYPAAVRRGAWEGLRDAAERLRAGAWPFDGGAAAAG